MGHDRRWIIMADGKATRWEGAVPKHLVLMDGEPLLHRTVRMLRERGEPDILVVGPEDPRYDVDGAGLFVRDRAEDLEIDKFLSSREQWHDQDTRFLYGDVWYSRTAMDRIVTTPTPESHWVFGRRFASRITGTRHGEIFAFIVARTRNGLLEQSCRALRQRRIMGDLRRAGSWELYQTLQGKEPNPFGRQELDAGWQEVDDWTEDFDTAEELGRWLRRRKQRQLQGQEVE